MLKEKTTKEKWVWGQGVSVGQEQKKPDRFFVASVAARLSFSRCWKEKEKSRRSGGRKINYFIFQNPFVLLFYP